MTSYILTFKKRSFFKKVLLLLLLISPALLVRYVFMTQFEKFYWGAATQSNSLVIGTSTEKQGIDPAMLSKVLELEDEPVNIAMTVTASPFGDSYNSFIRKKLASTDGQGLFIVGVSPRALTTSEGEEGQTRELDDIMYRMKVLNVHPNLEYFVRFRIYSNELLNFAKKYFLGRELPVDRIVHRNGWNQMIVRDSLPEETQATYGGGSELDQARIQALKDLLVFLSDRGNVFLVRMPKAQSALNELTDLFPDFDSFMDDLAHEFQCSYLNYSRLDDNFVFRDQTIHLESQSAQRFSSRLAEDIQKIIDSPPR